jgi:putative endonuclease
VYIIECENGAFYTGIALDMEDRLRRHFRGTGHSKYTRSFKAKQLLACWEISGTRGDALKVESFIKRGGRKFKEAVITLPSSLEEMVLRELDLKIKHEKTPLPENCPLDGPTC